MVIHVTEKLRKKLHSPPFELLRAPEDPFQCWYANLFVAGRTQYILTTNAASLYSIVMHGRGITSEDAYRKRFNASLGEHFAGVGMRRVFERYIAPHGVSVTLAKTEDRSVLGSMNDMVEQCKYLIEYRQSGLKELAESINGTPCRTLGYRTPFEEFANMGSAGID